jgi:iron complex transport system substrate-binding protein
MKRVTLILAGAVLAAACGGEIDRAAPAVAATDVPRRIVSLAPSLTETLFALGVGDRVVGVTRYCAHPPPVMELPKVGGHLDPNFEAIVSLEPDLVVAIPSSRENRLRLEALGIRAFEVDQHDVSAVLESIALVASACGVGERGEELRLEIEERLSAVEAVVASADKPRVVIVVGHPVGGGPVRSVWTAGPDTFYDGVIRLAGGVNAVGEGLARYPEISREGLASLDPDVVLDVIAGLEERNLDPDDLRRQWMRLKEMRAVRDGRVYILEGNEMVVPGPRMPEMVEVVARALHPELQWGGR